jgi:hypothetical protein
MSTESKIVNFLKRIDTNKNFFNMFPIPKCVDEIRLLLGKFLKLGKILFPFKKNGIFRMLIHRRGEVYMNMKKGILGLGVACLIFPSGQALGADDHFQGFSAVDSKEIRWGTQRGTTQWTTPRNHSITTWDALGKVNIAGDTASTIEDLSFYDFDGTTTLLGRYQQNPGADSIGYSNYNFSKMEDGERKKTALHEMGHALGFGHHDSGIMKQGKFSMTTLDSHIKADYEELY